MRDETEGLRRDLRRHDGARGKRFEPELRRRVVAYAERRRREGASWLSIAEELGACFETVRRWCSRGSVASRSLRRVEVVAEAIVAAPTSSLVVITPNGIRIEGVALEQVVVLVRALG